MVLFLKCFRNLNSFWRRNFISTVSRLLIVDLVSIPDFVSGAMENWGVVTFREVNLIFEEGRGSAAVQERVAYVVCHELAHMVNTTRHKMESTVRSI